MKLILAVAAGGVAGTLARYGLALWVPTWAGTGFPWATLSANVLGSLLLGFLARASELVPVSAELRGLLAVGFCGAFTTFSTLSHETVRLLQEGDAPRAALYSFGSLALGLASVYAGLALAGLCFRAAG